MTHRSVTTWTCDSCGAVAKTTHASMSGIRGRVLRVAEDVLVLNGDDEDLNFHRGLIVQARVSTLETGMRAGFATLLSSRRLNGNGVLTTDMPWTSCIPAIAEGDFLTGVLDSPPVLPLGWRECAFGRDALCAACVKLAEDAVAGALEAR